MNDTLFPPAFPASWASEWGQDRFGLYMDLNYQGVCQRFRWILPGSFLMGSPENEAQREPWGGDETQHRVTLTHGFWLADTACTQALWRAVMSGNTSHFTSDPDLPVESVSWLDVQQFIERLNALFPDLQAKLPSEAQWEYACRAGTQTPFSFGNNIRPKHVNYRNYAPGKKGLNREQTVLVKSLPPNPWGLYEMHGNVWEWCADWYGDYPKQAVINPIGTGNGERRVIRGGAWSNNEWDSRSARRSQHEPDYRATNLGVRLGSG